MVTLEQVVTKPSQYGWVSQLNGKWHERALWAFAVIVGGHWVEHLAQAIQIWWLGWSRPDSLGVIGLAFPALVKSEALHFGFALTMIAGLIILTPGFTGRARMWWLISAGIQIWHFIEHSLLQGQALFDRYLFGAEIPMSVAQVWVPRVELHLFYNLAVFVPMVIAMVIHARPPKKGDVAPVCSCAL